MTSKIFLTVALGIGNLWLSAPAGFAQGVLTPPGAPGPTMKTLAQIEPRTPVATNTTPGDANNLYIITQPGSYYLTANLFGSGSANGIEILTNNVTLDLNGFLLQSTPTNVAFVPNDAVYIPANQTNITVRNGLVSGWGYGLNSLGKFSANLVVEHVNFADCYVGPVLLACGIGTLGAVVVNECSFENDYCGVHCNYDNAPAPSCITGCAVDNCFLGIYCGGSGAISRCTVNNCPNGGIDVNGGQAWVVSDCTANNNGTGIYIAATGCRVENNHVIAPASGYGIEVIGAGSTNNIVIRNSVVGAGVNNYYFPANNITGPIVTATGTITNANSWANFSF